MDKQHEENVVRSAMAVQLRKFPKLSKEIKTNMKDLEQEIIVCMKKKKIVFNLRYSYIWNELVADHIINLFSTGMYTLFC